eukprot:8069747-Pyramimonas_sp.AAC.1
MFFQHPSQAFCHLDPWAPTPPTSKLMPLPPIRSHGPFLVFPSISSIPPRRPCGAFSSLGRGTLGSQVLFP